jgi:hypothetical protein
VGGCTSFRGPNLPIEWNDAVFPQETIGEKKKKCIEKILLSSSTQYLQSVNIALRN